MKQGLWRERILKIAYGILRVAGIGMFLLLTGAAFVSTSYILPGAEELPVNKGDNPIFNLLFLGGAFGILFWIRKFLAPMAEKRKNNVEKILMAVSLLWIIGMGIWWNVSLDRRPEGDQAFIYGAASYFLEGDYSFLAPGGYCQLYPQQLGLIALMEGLFAIVGKYQYFVFQMICVFMGAGIVFLGRELQKQWKVSLENRIFYLIMMMGCLPLLFYTSWVYGDVPSIFFALLAALFLSKFTEHTKWYYGIGVVVSSVLAVMVRKNSIIFLIAMGIMAVIFAIKNKKAQVLLVVAAVVAASFLGEQGIYAMYESRSGQKIEGGLPVSSWIAMGMQEHRGVCGWYNNMPKQVAEECNWDFKATENIVNDIIKQRMSDFTSNPTYGAGFYGKKILTQWNAPLYQSVYFSAKYEGEAKPASGGLIEGLYETDAGFFGVLGYADGMQFLVYVGMLLFFVFGLKKEENPMHYVLLVTIIGGFLFSILWEAKARYSFPYFIMMYPYAGLGYAKVLELLKRKKKET